MQNFLLTIFMTFLFFTAQLEAQNISRSKSPQITILGYYSQSWSQLAQLKDGELKDLLHNAITYAHITGENFFERLAPNCSEVNDQEKCFQHKTLARGKKSYKASRLIMFYEIFGKKVRDTYHIEDIYCSRKLEIKYTGEGRPSFTPDHNQINTEHAWPQSKFGDSKRNMKKADLHHLYPSDNPVNGQLRSNIALGEVDESTAKIGRVETGNGIDCSENMRGQTTGEFGSSSLDFFEPKDEFKGDFARSYFYFSTRYKMPISSIEESFLRKWHKLDPVSALEMKKNHLIHQFQGNRNPYIDFPELVERISDF